MRIEQTIYATAMNDGMPPLLSQFIVAQSKHETGNYSSRFFTIGHNAFGYSFVPGSKWQLSTPGPMADNNAAIAQYASLQNSVHEITDWIKRRQRDGKFPVNLKTIQTPEQYAFLLKSAGYYGASYSSYADRLRYWFTNLPPLAKTGGSLLLILTAAYIFRKELGFI